MRRKKRELIRTLLISMIMVVLIVSFIFAAELPSDKYVARPTEDTIYLYSDKSTDSSVTAVLFSDFNYTVMYSSDDWVKIKVNDELYGYVESNSVILLEGAVASEGDAYTISSVLSNIATPVEDVVEEVVELDKIDDTVAEIQSIKSEAEEYLDITTQVETYIDDIEEALSIAQNAQTSEEAYSARDMAQNILDKTQTKAEEITQLRQNVADYACSFVGKLKYVYGGTSLKTGADCSGFIQAVYKAYGYSIPRTTASQCYAGTSVSYSDLKVGDLLLFSGHVAMYIGDGKIVHSPQTGEYVSIASLSSYSGKIKTIRRIIV